MKGFKPEPTDEELQRMSVEEILQALQRGLYQGRLIVLSKEVRDQVYAANAAKSKRIASGQIDLEEEGLRN